MVVKSVHLCCIGFQTIEEFRQMQIVRDAKMVTFIVGRHPEKSSSAC